MTTKSKQMEFVQGQIGIALDQLSQLFCVLQLELKDEHYARCTKCGDDTFPISVEAAWLEHEPCCDAAEQLVKLQKENEVLRRNANFYVICLEEWASKSRRMADALDGIAAMIKDANLGDDDGD